MKSIKKVSDEIEADLQRYLESQYHLHHPRLLRERRALMNDGETSTEPWVEATPSYVSGDRFRDLGLPDPVVDLLKDLEDDVEIYDPPYQHQANGLQAFFNDEKDLIVSTGTGSGKTEIFLYSILGQLAQEAERGKSTDQRGIRTLVLYPMNALVADQLSRMRQLFGDEEGAETIADRMGRNVQFGMYTSRTPYHGEYDTEKNDRRLKPIVDRYLNLMDERPDLYRTLEERGRIPTKDLEGYRAFGQAKETHFRTQPGDTELFSRQEMHSSNEHGGIPDLLITNYSMLEYMLLRPIEQEFFQETRDWLEADNENELNIVLDEAHLYRGAQGAEVGLLLSRLLQNLEISRDRVRFILTSATMGDNIDEAAPEFAADLTAGEEEDFAVIKGHQIAYPGGKPADDRTAELLTRVGYELDAPAIRNLASERGWEPYEDPNESDTDEKKALSRYLATTLEDDPLFAHAHDHLQEEPLKLEALATELFPETDTEVAKEATGNLLYLCTEAREGEGQALLPTRLHMFLKGLPKQYVCVNPECPGRRITEGPELLGRMFANPSRTCPDCESRVFELLSHRTCGAAYLRAYRRSETGDKDFLWTESGSDDELEEIHLLVEEPRDDRRSEDHSLRDVTPKRQLDINSGHLLHHRYIDHDSPENYINVWVPPEDPPEEDYPRSWTQCPVCGVEEGWNHGETKIQDLETKGEEPFANIVRSMFQAQPEDSNKQDLPNKGKKVLCFSDGRQKAARLARDLQSNVEVDSFREVIADIFSDNPDLSMDGFFLQFAIYCKKNQVAFFNDSDEYITANGVQYPGSRSHFESILDEFETLMERYGLDSIEEVPGHPAARTLYEDRPRQFDSTLLKALGDEYFSISESLIGYLRPQPEVLENIQAEAPELDDDLTEAIIVEVIAHACQERAYDAGISSYQRADSHPYRRFADQGLTFEELIPEYILEAVGSELADVQMSLKAAFTGQKPILFEGIGPDRYVINPSAVTVDLRVDDPWYRCTGCHRFSPTSFDGACPRGGCGGTLEQVDDDDIHLQARKNFLREPPREVASDKRDAFTLRSEEHSAQLTSKDNSEAMSRSEEYELLFQDILVGDEDEQPIDVLSCTTTMEVGIDIGSLTGVAMRTVPPAPENYEQRAGRAGRRGAGLSTIVTYADNSPHESRYFESPEDMISDPGTEPIIYAGNEKIAQRHVNASLVARFFGTGNIEPGANVFESLGTGAAFFAGDGNYTIDEFESWIESEVLPERATVAREIGALLPGELGETRADDWREEFVTDATMEFMHELWEVQAGRNWNPEGENEDDLLSVLLDAALLPTFSFPIDVCDFVVRGADQESNRPKVKYEMSRDLKQALSTYVPGREIVVDKKTYESYGVYFNFPQDPEDRASGVEWDDLDWLNFCPRCDMVYENRDESMAAQGDSCTVCGEEELVSLEMFRPPAFAPEVDAHGNPKEADGYSEDRVYPTAPKYPITPTDEDRKNRSQFANSKQFGPSEAGHLRDESLVIANLGPDERGFEVCTKCGAVGTDGLSNPHNRPYPKDPARMNLSDFDNQCSGSAVTTCFKHSFNSDLTIFQIPLVDPMKFVPGASWFDSAAQSLAEALVMGASRALEIEDNELEGGYRTRSADVMDDPDGTGVVEIFLFDTTPGGAGFASKAWHQFKTVLDEARRILMECDCESACHDCLRRYDNRHLHGSLDRHLGSALLEYAEDGTIPKLGSDLTSSLMTQVEHSLRLQMDDVDIQQYPGSEDRWEIINGTTNIVVGVRSCLRDRRDDTDLDEDLSDYILSNKLPEVVNSLHTMLDG